MTNKKEIARKEFANRGILFCGDGKILVKDVPENDNIKSMLRELSK